MNHVHKLVPSARN